MEREGTMLYLKKSPRIPCPQPCTLHAPFFSLHGHVRRLAGFAPFCGLSMYER